MSGNGYGSSGSSRGSTPSPRSSSYLQPLSIQPKDPKHTYGSTRQYPDPYLEPPRSSTLAPPRVSSSSNKPASSRSSKSSTSLKPPSIRRSNDYPRDQIKSDKTTDPRYYPNSYLDKSRDAKKNSSSRKETDARYYANSSYYRD